MLKDNKECVIGCGTAKDRRVMLSSRECLPSGLGGDRKSLRESSGEVRMSTGSHWMTCSLDLTSAEE